MSRRALAFAVRDRLRAAAGSGGLNLPLAECGLAPAKGMPPPRCGQRYVGIWHQPRRANGPPCSGLDETYGIAVTVTFRAPKIPFDRWGEELVDADSGLNDLVDAIRVSLHQDSLTHVVINAANAIISGGTPTNATQRGFTTGLAFQGDTEPRPVGGEWFQAHQQEGLAGLVVDMWFGGARRVQTFNAVDHEET